MVLGEEADELDTTRILVANMACTVAAAASGIM
jgi:hypothetical protein